MCLNFIAVKVTVMDTSSGDTSFFDEELEQRIAIALSELEEKSAQIVTLENEIGDLKASLTPILGVAFMQRIEEDPTWVAVDSEDFDEEYLHHEIAAVANIATLVKRAYTLKEECKELTQRVEQLRESQRFNKYSPVEKEMFRHIENLRKEMASQRTDNIALRDQVLLQQAEIKALREETADIQEQIDNMVKERMGIEADRAVAKRMRTDVVESVVPEALKAKGYEKAAEVEAAEFLFDSLSAPGLTTVTAGEAASVTVANSSDYNYAISSIELHRSHPSQWQVEVLNNIGFGIVLGIIGKKKPTASPSFQDVTCFGWSSSINVYVAGTAQWAVCSWDGWKTGDKGIFTYSPSEATLSLRLLRGGSIRDFYIDKCSLPDGAFIHLFVQYGAAVRFSRVV